MDKLSPDPKLSTVGKHYELELFDPMFQILGCLLRAAVVVATWTQRQQVGLLIRNSSTHQQLLTIRLLLRQLQQQLTTTGTEVGSHTISNTTHTTSLPKV